MKNYDVTVQIAGGYEAVFSLTLSKVEAENEEIAKTLAVSYVKSLIKFEVIGTKEVK